MKSHHRFTSMLTTAALVALGSSLHAGQDKAKSDGSMQQSSGSSMNSSTLGKISRVSEEAVDHQFTAKDLIGAGVYDTAGEKIGDISDIVMQGSSAKELARTFEAAERRDVDDTSPTTRSTTGSAGTELERSAEHMGSELKQSAHRFAQSVGGSDTFVLISVGGLWGVGDDLVSAPLSELSYNAAEEHFELSASKADVVALAEQDDNMDAYASDYDTDTTGTTAGKQAFSDDASKVQQALRSDPQTSGIAYKISVTSDGEDVELRGTVDSKDQHDKILKAARQATTQDINDKIEVRE